MPEARFDDVQAVTLPTPQVRKGNSRYVLVPADWPEDGRVRLLLVTRHGPKEPPTCPPPPAS